MTSPTVETEFLYHHGFSLRMPTISQTHNPKNLYMAPEPEMDLSHLKQVTKDDLETMANALTEALTCSNPEDMIIIDSITEGK